MGKGSEVKKPVLSHKKPMLSSQKKKEIGVEIVVSDKVKAASRVFTSVAGSQPLDQLLMSSLHREASLLEPLP